MDTPHPGSRTSRRHPEAPGDTPTSERRLPRYPTTTPLALATSAPARQRIAITCVVLGPLLLACALGFMTLGGGIGVLGPSDPETASVGFTRGDDGTVRVVVARADQCQATRLQLYGAPTAQRPTWEAVRTPTAPPTWDGDLALGQAPPGWTVIRSTARSPDRATQVVLANDCYGSPQDVPTPTSLQEEQVVAYEDVPAEPEKQFLAQGTGGFSPCGDAWFVSALRSAKIAAATGAAGVTVLALGLALRPGRGRDATMARR